MEFLSYLINGISMGSIYAIIALGYTMVYGIAKMLNFAHGDVIMVGAYVSFYVTSFASWQPAGGYPLVLCHWSCGAGVCADCHGGMHSAGRGHRGTGLPAIAPGWKLWRC